MRFLVNDARTLDQLLPLVRAIVHKGFTKLRIHCNTHHQAIVVLSVFLQQRFERSPQIKFRRGVVLDPALEKTVYVLNDVFGISDFKLLVALFCG